MGTAGPCRSIDRDELNRFRLWPISGVVSELKFMRIRAPRAAIPAFARLAGVIAAIVSRVAAFAAVVTGLAAFAAVVTGVAAFAAIVSAVSTFTAIPAAVAPFATPFTAVRPSELQDWVGCIEVDSHGHRCQAEAEHAGGGQQEQVATCNYVSHLFHFLSKLHQNEMAEAVSRNR